jgi:hypothetical protein
MTHRARSGSVSWPSLAIASAVVGVVGAMWLVAPAGAEWTHSNSSCNLASREDPANIQFHGLNISSWANNGGTIVVNYLDPATGAQNIARKYWNHGIGESPSYFWFPADSSCRGNAGYATSSWTSGWHARFWNGPGANAGQRSFIWGAAHHDFYCWSHPPHGSSDYGKAAKQLAQDFAAYSDSTIGQGAALGSFTYSSHQDRSPSVVTSCQVSTYDDGLTYDVIQQPPSVFTQVRSAY